MEGQKRVFTEKKRRSELECTPNLVSPFYLKPSIFFRRVDIPHLLTFLPNNSIPERRNHLGHSLCALLLEGFSLFYSITLPTLPSSLSSPPDGIETGGEGGAGHVRGEGEWAKKERESSSLSVEYSLVWRRSLSKGGYRLDSPLSLQGTRDEREREHVVCLSSSLSLSLALSSLVPPLKTVSLIQSTSLLYKGD